MFKIRTSLNNRSNAQKIGRVLLETHAAVSVHIREAESIFAWEDKINNAVEYEMEILCRDPQAVYNIITENHPYQIPEFLVFDLDASDDIEKWCNDWCSQYGENNWHSPWSSARVN